MVRLELRLRVDHEGKGKGKGKLQGKVGIARRPKLTLDLKLKLELCPSIFKSKTPPPAQAHTPILMTILLPPLGTPIHLPHCREARPQPVVKLSVDGLSYGYDYEDEEALEADPRGRYAQPQQARARGPDPVELRELRHPPRAAQYAQHPVPVPQRARRAQAPPSASASVSASRRSHRPQTQPQPPSQSQTRTQVVTQQPRPHPAMLPPSSSSARASSSSRSQSKSKQPIARRTQLNPKGVPLNQDGTREWSICKALWCPCIIYASNKARLEHLALHNAPLPEEEREEIETGGWNEDCVIHGVLSAVSGCLCGWVIQIQSRTATRRRYHIAGDWLGDCCAALCCCSACELAQESREIGAEEGWVLREGEEGGQWGYVSARRRSMDYGSGVGRGG
ncbi:LOW QUALITY PROTEIN: hypothetical protein CVT26_012332 [Gymnopilus dilepis]|uniref:PLAC8-domain-containing protein n=1 Tax=Gymnopilus dilepis TaxID=231916 RepID=A0A409X5M5_9AGAR|nr:LOW QUALITY PROTEIN: hypothetical protein CVT26_012332 [Gymnopilus dilepis]